jgi:hypothetical protein
MKYLKINHTYYNLDNVNIFPSYNIETKIYHINIMLEVGSEELENDFSNIEDMKKFLKDKIIYLN